MTKNFVKNHPFPPTFESLLLVGLKKFPVMKISNDLLEINEKSNDNLKKFKTALFDHQMANFFHQTKCIFYHSPPGNFIDHIFDVSSRL